MVSLAIEIQEKEVNKIDPSMPTLQTPSTLVVTISDKEEGDGTEGNDVIPSFILSITYVEDKEDKEMEETKRIDKAKKQVHTLVTFPSVTLKPFNPPIQCSGYTFTTIITKCQLT